jgi:hypothetical protein
LAASGGKEGSVSKIDDIWPHTLLAAEETPTSTPQMQVVQQNSEPHFPFSSKGEATRMEWPTTALSFAPAAAALGPN